MNRTTTIRNTAQPRAAFGLLVTLVVLVVLSALTASLATRLTMAKRRQQYMIEYQRARYGLDSGLKYILSEMPKMTFPVKPRMDNPDFSDLFTMNQDEYADMIAAWAAEATDEQIDAAMKEGAGLYDSQPLDIAGLLSGLSSMYGDEDSESDPNLTTMGTADANDISEAADDDTYVVELDPNDIEVPGPYGFEWPLAAEPIEMEIGPCKIKITIEDENAKLPLSWLVTTYKKDDKTVEYALETFLEWMAEDNLELTELKESLVEEMQAVYAKKRFTLNAGDILVKSTRSTSSSRTRYRTIRQRDPKTGKITTKRVPISGSSTASKTATASKKRPAVAHRTDFAKLFNSSLLNQDQLNIPRTDRGTADRVETVLKYIGLWGSQRVNVNTAPRHVLEAAFSMAMTYSEAKETAHEVIIKRQEKPFKKVDEIKTAGMLDTETFDKLKNYITTTSTFFKIRVESRSGNAGASAVAAVVKEGRQAETLMVLYGR